MLLKKHAIKLTKGFGVAILGLPKPKQVVKDLTEDDLEDIVKPKDAELALREKPPVRATVKTKIVIPSLPSVCSRNYTRQK